MANNKNSTRSTSDSSTAPRFSRRALLKQAGVASAVALGSSAPLANAASEHTTPTGSSIPVREAFETLTAAESETLDAMVDRILPSDANGPGAREARAVHFIDRALAGYLSSQRTTYALGLLAIDTAAQTQHGKAFHLLTSAQQDALLQAVANNEIDGFASTGAAFFSLVRNHTIDGTFSDPYYGGNRDYIGWDMLGYPGVRMGASPADVRDEETIAPSHQSAYDLPPFTKQPVGGA